MYSAHTYLLLEKQTNIPDISNRLATQIHKHM